MRRFLRAYTRAVGIAGSLLLALALIRDGDWVWQPLSLLGAIVLVGTMRAFQISLTKYSALNLLGSAAVAGAFVLIDPFEKTIAVFAQTVSLLGVNAATGFGCTVTVCATLS